jgi:cytidine deaminase
VVLLQYDALRLTIQKSTMMDTAQPQAVLKPELFFGLVAPVGSELSRVTEDLERALGEVGYKTETIHIIEQIHELDRWKDLPESPLDVRIHKHMDAGNELRRLTDRGDAVAMLGVGGVRKIRVNLTGDKGIPAANRAYIFRSLKHPAEVKTLRSIYGDGFFLVAAYSPRHRRIEHLSAEIAESHHKFQAADFRAAAELLNQRDEAEVGDEAGQDVRDTFPLADLFVDTSDPAGCRYSVNRFIELLFGHPYHTPKRGEFAMFHAQASALRSSALGRQVGAVITNCQGDIISVGTNEVPKAGGGLYWCDDEPDHRDFTLGFDTNDKIRANIITEILQHLKDAEWFTEDKKQTDIEALVQLAMTGKKRVLPKTSQVMNVTEFGRSVHAEMAALMDAARRGAGVSGAILFTTTFPCHNCAKHIVAAGIRSVVYVEPYPKSLAGDLHLDAIEVNGTGCGEAVNFRPFVGISPRRYFDLFTAVERKGADGKVLTWNSAAAEARFFATLPVYVMKETKELSDFLDCLEVKGISAVESN